MEKVSIIGAGGWGTALSVHLSRKGFPVFLWERFPDYAKELSERRENYKFLPGIKIPLSIHITSSLEEALKEAEIVIIAVPSRYFRSVVKEFKNYPKQALFISVTKGIEEESLKRMTEILKEELGVERIGALSGPSHAEEVARFLPTAVVASSEDKEIARAIQEIFMAPNLRVYANSDLKGVELGGALKNIIAISCGISDGLGFGDNAKAALMTRGMVEITRLGVSMGARPSTFWGLAGIGDLIVTCTSSFSRNRWLGERIGKGEKLSSVEEKMEMVAEGVPTTRSAMRLAEKYGVEMPITRAVYQILFEGKNPKEGVMELMERTPREEEDFKG